MKLALNIHTFSKQNYITQEVLFRHLCAVSCAEKQRALKNCVNECIQYTAEEAEAGLLTFIKRCKMAVIKAVNKRKCCYKLHVLLQPGTLRTQMMTTLSSTFSSGPSIDSTASTASTQVATATAWSQTYLN